MNTTKVIKAMSKTKIEWCDYTVNPVKGLCPVGCSYCYARRLYKRFRWDPTVRYNNDWWRDIAVLRTPSRVFVGSTMELFGPWVQQDWRDKVLGYCRRMPQHSFIFLTKRPESLIEWSPFPDNCWVGVTATNALTFIDAHNWLYKARPTMKFISLEPLLDWDPAVFDAIKYSISDRQVDWLIIGQQTPASNKTEPRVEWIREIVEVADRASVPVFLKDNLLPLFEREGIAQREDWSGLRQEFPKEKYD